MRIVFVRHGKDEPDYRGGWSRRGLIPQGLWQAKVLSHYLADHYSPVHQIIYSDLARATQTAQILNEVLHCPMIGSQGWREIDNGDLAGMPEDEARRRFPGLFFDALEMDQRYPGGESPVEFRNRIAATLGDTCRQVVQGELGPDLLVVTHGGAIRVVCHEIESILWTNKSKAYPVSDTGIYVLEHADDSWVLSVRNDTKHLERC